MGTKPLLSARSSHKNVVLKLERSTEQGSGGTGCHLYLQVALLNS
jgi:hypothetical protein